MVIVLHPDQASEVALLAGELDMDPSLVVRQLLSGPLSQHWDAQWAEGQLVSA